MSSNASETAAWAFTEDQVRGLSGLSLRQIRYWNKTGFFKPSAHGGLFYSFRDLVGLRTIANLRKTVPLQELRKIGEWLATWHDTPWASLRFYLSGKNVYVQEPQSGAHITRLPEGQVGIPILMSEIADEVAEEVRRARTRPADTLGQITKRRGVARNQAVIAGTRIPVTLITQMLEDGETAAQIVEQYPALTAEDVEAVRKLMETKRSA